MLDSLCRHGTPDCLSVSILVVVENPSSFLTTEERESFHRELSSWETGAWVRVWIQESNGGASSARNTGLCQSAGDYLVFLDDDTEPDPDLLQAYAGKQQPLHYPMQSTLYCAILPLAASPDYSLPCLSSCNEQFGCLLMMIHCCGGPKAPSPGSPTHQCSWEEHLSLLQRPSSSMQFSPLTWTSSTGLLPSSRTLRGE